jgi:hypothetical protein
MKVIKLPANPNAGVSEIYHKESEEIDSVFGKPCPWTPVRVETADNGKSGKLLFCSG